MSLSQYSVDNDLGVKYIFDTSGEAQQNVFLSVVEEKRVRIEIIYYVALYYVLDVNIL